MSIDFFVASYLLPYYLSHLTSYFIHKGWADDDQGVTIERIYLDGAFGILLCHYRYPHQVYVSGNGQHADRLCSLFPGRDHTAAHDAGQRRNTQGQLDPGSPATRAYRDTGLLVST